MSRAGKRGSLQGVKKWLLVGVVWLGLVGSAQGAYNPSECDPPGPLSLDPPFACGHTFTATAKPTRWVATKCCSVGYVSHWYADTGQGMRGFRAWAPDGNAGCRFYGSKGPVRVREVVCRKHRIVVFVRSVAGPIPVRLTFEVQPRGPTRR